MTPHLLPLSWSALFFAAGFLFGRWCYKRVAKNAKGKE